MRLPRLPFRSKKDEGKPGPSRRGLGLRRSLGRLTLLLLFFLLGLYLFFPAESLKARVEQEIAAHSKVEAKAETLSLLFPPALRARQIALRLPPPAGQTVAIESLTLRPLWLSLFTARPGLRVQSDLFGGDLEGTLRRGGELTLEASRLALAAPLAAGSSIQMAALLEQGSFAGAYPLKPDAETRLELTLREVRITGLAAGGSGSDALSLGTLTLRGSGKGNALRIEELKASGGHLEGTGGGTILLAEPLDRSRLALNLTLRPAAGLDPGLAELLTLFVQPARDGSLPLRVSGTLAAPSLR